MDDAEFDECHRTLVAALDEASSLLDGHGAFRWAGMLRQLRVRVAAGDRWALGQLLSMFGGMGSLNDLVFHPVNGNSVTGQDAEDNERLQRLCGVMRREARALQRDLDRA